MLLFGKSECKMDTVHHSKNGINPQKPRIEQIVMFLFGLFILQSCATLTLSGNHAILDNNSTYSSVDMKLNTQYYPQFSTDFYLGVGKMDFSKSDLIYSEIDKASKIAPSVGVGLSYYFSSKRLQPIVALDYNYLFWTGSEIESAKEKKDTFFNNYQSVNPKAGIRYYITNKVAINGYLGYQFGWAEIENVKQNFHGFVPSVGISFSLWKKEQ